MMGKVLSVVGGVAVIAALVAAGAGLALVKDRIRVVVADDDSAQRADPLQLLRDDVVALQRGLDEVRDGLRAGFERVGAALDERADGRHGELLAAIRQPVDLVRGELARQRQDLDRLALALTRLEALAAARTAEAPAALPPHQDRPVDESAVAAAPAPAAAAPAAAAPAAAAEAPAAENPVDSAAAPAKNRAFLSFALPDTRFRFDAPQDFALLPELSRVGFDAKSTLHDFSGVTSDVQGQFHADLDDPQGDWRGEVVCRAAALTTGLEGRDENMRTHLDTAHHPEIRFRIDRFVPAHVDAGAQTTDGIVHGRMTIHGTQHDVQMPVAVKVDASRRVSVEGQMPLKLSDYGVEVPSQLGGAISMQDEVQVWIALRARVRSGGSR